jgi:transcriptional regulator with XRE-family HTH domain
MLLTLRSATGLSQSSLAEFLGISRRAISDWEAGKSYPKINHLKKFIELAVEHRALRDGEEAEEIRFLWKASHQKVLLDETWLFNLLGAQSKDKPDEAQAVKKEDIKKHKSAEDAIYVDWDDAFTIDVFYGREWELNLLKQWIIEEHCRVISIIGLGGIGKSALAVHLMHQIAEEFEIVIWRSLRDLVSCDHLLISLLQVLAPHTLNLLSENLEERLSLLMDHLRKNKVLLVLDNLETVLTEEDSSGHIRTEYAGFERFLRYVSQTNHQASILLTSSSGAS